MIGYVTIGAADVEAALPFFDAVFGAIGGERKSFEGGWAFYGDKGGEGDVGICKPQDGQAARAGNGIMIAFKAASHDAVRADPRRGAGQRRQRRGRAGLPPARRHELLRRLLPRPGRQQVLHLPHPVKPPGRALRGQPRGKERRWAASALAVQPTRHGAARRPPRNATG